MSAKWLRQQVFMSERYRYTGDKLKRAKEYLKTYSQGEEAIPTKAGLARYLKVSKEAVEKWCEDEDKLDFAKLIDAIEAEAEKTLVTKGLTGQMNATVSKLVLGQHGYSDKQDSNVNGDLTVKLNKKDFTGAKKDADD